MAIGVAGLLALAALSLVAVSPGTSGVVENVASAHTPACPSSLPATDGETFWTDSDGNRWFIIRQTSGSGHTTVQAYVASTAYDAGYIPSSPHETCVLKVRGPDDDADLDPPVQIFFPNDDNDDNDDDDSSSSSTEATPTPSASFSLSESSDGSEGSEGSEGLETTGLATIGLA